jgi:hypothetical protein
MEPSDSADAEASRRERAERAWDRADARYARQVAAAAEAGKLAIRAALIVNSGAALALFLFLVGGFPGGEVSAQLDYPDRIARAIRSFAVGAFLAACAAGAGFLFNQIHAGAVARARYVESYPHIRDTAVSLKLRRVSLAFMGLTIGLVVVSLVFFLLGLGSLRLR